MADLPSGNSAAESASMADLALDLADQLISAFQQTAQGTGDGEGEVTQDDGTLPSDNGAVDPEAEATDGNDNWQELAGEDEAVGGLGNGVKGEGVGEENPDSWVSPLRSHQFMTEVEVMDMENNVDNMDLVFAPARVLNFDDSDGDDMHAVDQRFIPRGVFVQSDFMDDRPELHGSEEGDYFAGSTRANVMLGDHSQNVRIIEGHDDLDLDRGAGYMSLAMRNRFLQTQMVQLPPLPAEDPNLSANLYDSLEREEEDAYVQDDQEQEGDEEDMGNSGQDFLMGEDGNNPREVNCQHPDGQLLGCESAAAADYVYDSQRTSRTLNQGDQGHGGVYEEATGTAARSPTRNTQSAASQGLPHSVEQEQQVLLKNDGQKDLGQDSQLADDVSLNRSTAIVVTIPKPSNSSGNLVPGSGGGSEPPVTENRQQLSARPKQPINKQQPRGGPAGSNGREVNNPGNKPHVRVNLTRGDQRGGVASVNNRVRGRAGVGSGVGSVRQQGGGAQSQRPAVQGAAVAAAGISGGGDGDGAVAGHGTFAVQGQSHNNPGMTGAMLSSRTSSQGSIHSNASNNSNSRVSGVGKESNSNRGYHPGATRLTDRSGAHSLTAGGRVMPPPAQPQPQLQLQPPHQQQSADQPSLSAGTQPSRRPAQPPSRLVQQPCPSKLTAAAEKRRADSRTALLQQQRNQLQQEQQHLQQKQRQLQQQQHQQQRQQQPLQQGGVESPDGDDLVHHQPDVVVTQMGRMQQEDNRQERPGGINSTMEVQEMEEVRNMLQGMLRVPKESTAFDHRGFDFADSASDLMMDRTPYFPLDGDNNSLSGFRAHNPEEMSEMFENFPSFPYKMFSEMSNISAASDRSLPSENAYLRENLEKERYRRKHCEQQIQNLNARLLEVQQQLAVAVSTDKRKDIMIDQLDKQLAKVVEGWKKREAEKDEYMAMVMKEKGQIEETLHKQQMMIDSFEKELANTVEELKQEKENSAELVDKMKTELSSALHERRHTEEMLAAEKERATLVEREWEQLKESRDLAEKRAQQAQDHLHQEQDNWYQREQELLHKIDQVKEANLKVMQMERVKLEEQMKKVEDTEEKVHTAETEVKRLEMEVDSALREKESLKVEMALAEAKFESSQRSLEADLLSQTEKRVSEEVSEVHSRLRQEQEEQEERHRQMVSELHQRHQRDLEVQMAALRQDLSHKEMELKQQLAQLEDRLGDVQQENTALKQAKQRLESQRMEVLSKLQVIMQSQWREAVSLLVTTPQRKTLNTSLTSSLTSSMLGGVGLFMDSSLPSSSAGPQFNLTSSAQTAASAAAARASSPKTASRTEQQGSSDESPPFNNLSGSQSSHSSPRGSLQPRSSTAVNTANSSSSKQSSAFGSKSPFPSDSAISLQDISTLLSDGHYLPPDFSTAVHGVTHNGGLVVQTRPSGERNAHHRQSHSQQPRQPSSGAQAVMIRPPQQSSHTANSSRDDLSFISTSDISQTDLMLTSRPEAARSQRQPQREDHRGGRESAESANDPRGQHLVSDRGLELSDLGVGSQAGLRDNLLMVNGGYLGNVGRPDLMRPPAQAYSPSLSPPVKQGRDGDRDSTEGDVLHESDRLNSSYREISKQLEQHQSRQRELQHYIRMLLDKPPQSINEQPERDSVTDPDAMSISLSSVELGLTDAAQAAQMNTELQRLQQLRDRQLAADQPSQSRTGSKKSDASGGNSTSRTGASTVGAHQGGSLPPHQLAEISRLLSQYSEDVEASNAAFPLGDLQSDPASMAQIISFLASLPQQPVSEKDQRSSSTKNSPREQQSRRTREPHRSKRSSDLRHHSVGPDSSLCSSSSLPLERVDKVMSTSTRSTTSTSKKAEKKATNGTTAATSASTTKQSSRPLSKEQHPIWK